MSQLREVGELRFAPIKALKRFNSIRNSASYFLHDSRWFSVEDTEAWWPSNKNNYIGIYTDDELIGYFRFSEDTGKSICIGADLAPEYRGLGIAKRAYSIMLSMLRLSGYERIWLEVVSFNERAVGLYEALGFVEVDRQPQAIKRGSKRFDNIVMELM